jgi:hypothetical protein
MQPNSDKKDWQQPSSQPSQAPYAVVPEESTARTPVVTLEPDMPQPVTTWHPTDSGTAVDASVVDESTNAVASPQSEALASESEPIRWQATEYIHHEKDATWFILFAVVVVALMVISIFVIDSITFTVLIPVMAAALLVYTRRPPRLIDYTLSQQGLYVNDHLYSFAEFKGFGVIHDKQEFSIMLIPTKRFRPGVSVYFPEEAGEAIVDMLGARLPMQELHLDMVDKLIHKLRI